MQAQTIQPTIAETIIAAWANALTVAPGAALLTTPHLHLFTALTGFITPTSTVSQFTEATFPGYSSPLLTLTGPLNFLNSAGLGLGGNSTFVANNTITPPGQNILGYWIDNAATGGTLFYAAELFSSPIQIVNPFDFLELTVILGTIYKPLVG